MSSGVTVRRAEAGELDAVGELTVRAYLADGMVRADSSYTERLADAAGRDRDAELLVATSADGNLLGTVTICGPGSPLAEISRPGEVEFRMLGVEPEARGRGIGAALVDAVLHRADELGAHRVVMCSAERMRAAHRLYARLGFQRLPERDWYPVPGFRLLAFASGERAEPGMSAGHAGHECRTRGA